MLVDSSPPGFADMTITGLETNNSCDSTSFFTVLSGYWTLFMKKSIVNLHKCSFEECSRIKDRPKLWINAVS